MAEHGGPEGQTLIKHYTIGKTEIQRILSSDTHENEQSNMKYRPEEKTDNTHKGRDDQQKYTELSNNTGRQARQRMRQKNRKETPTIPKCTAYIFS